MSPSLWRVGAHLSTLAGLRRGPGPASLGRIACFVVAREKRQWSQPLLLASRHVLGAQAGLPVFAPEVRSAGTILEFGPGGLDPFAAVTGEGLDGPVRFGYPGESSADFHVDCAVARILDEDALPFGGSAFRVGRPHRGDSVRLLGAPDTGRAVVTDIDATVERVDGTLCRGTIVVRSRAAPARFAAEGDSGALLLDARGRAAGLLWGVDLTDPSIAYACHLRPVLERLDVVPSLRVGLVSREEP